MAGTTLVRREFEVVTKMMLCVYRQAST